MSRARNGLSTFGRHIYATDAMSVIASRTGERTRAEVRFYRGNRGGASQPTASHDPN
jgi:hypothetical protein